MHAGLAHVAEGYFLRGGHGLMIPSIEAVGKPLGIGPRRCSQPCLHSPPPFTLSPMTITYCFGAGFTSGVGAGALGSIEGVVPRSSDATAQFPAQILVPLTVPTNVQPIGADGVTRFGGLPLLGAAV
jgi:hypothetical protein